jgi:hypothetical protein
VCEKADLDFGEFVSGPTPTLKPSAELQNHLKAKAKRIQNLKPVERKRKAEDAKEDDRTKRKPQFVALTESTFGPRPIAPQLAVRSESEWHEPISRAVPRVSRATVHPVLSESHFGQRSSTW